MCNLAKLFQFSETVKMLARCVNLELASAALRVMSAAVLGFASFLLFECPGLINLVTRTDKNLYIPKKRTHVSR